MLQRLIVENYALIDHLEMELDKNLNIITGETGAGKSILLGALGMLMGNKNEGNAMKDNSQNCVIEGTFNLEGYDLEPLFEEFDWDYEPQIAIRRVITPSGKSRAFVGDMPVQLADLKELSSKLIDIHSQHQNRNLSSEAFRTQALDTFAANSDLLSKYRESFAKLQSLIQQLKAAEEQAAIARRDEQWLTHQVEELTVAAIKEGECAELEAELTILENADRISEVLTNIRNRMDDEQMGVLMQVKSCVTELKSIANNYPTAAEYNERMASVMAELKDMNSSISAESERIESNPARLEKVSNRLNLFYQLQQKHRTANVEDLIELHNNLSAQLNSITQSTEHIEQLKSQITATETKSRELADKIHSKRSKSAPKFAEQICTTLHKLGMADAKFIIDIAAGERLSTSGFDTINYLFSANQGKSPQPIDKIASGGELSRVMLALKAMMARHAKLPTIIFDEIDTGVSGRIADAMGEIISDLSQSMQVVDITHLPQVAAKGNTHFVVYKSEGRTNITKLTSAQRIEQIATMLSGSSITEAATTQAKILLGI